MDTFSIVVQLPSAAIDTRCPGGATGSAAAWLGLVVAEGTGVLVDPSGGALVASVVTGASVVTTPSGGFLEGSTIGVSIGRDGRASHALIDPTVTTNAVVSVLRFIISP